MFRNQELAEQTLTNAATVTFNPSHDVNSNGASPTFNGTVAFQVLAASVSGTLAGNCQLQGSMDNTTWTNIGSTVAIADGVAVLVPLGGTILYYNYYRVTVTGSGTQSTTLNCVYNAKGE